MNVADFDPVPVVLEDAFVRLEPLAEQHADALLAAAADPATWRYLPHRPFVDRDDVLRWIAEADAARARGEALAFATIDKARGVLVGSTRYLDIVRPHRRLEIGWTWLAPDARRTAVNTAAKRLLLGHAFDDLGAIRVSFKTDARNAASRAAILRLGAHEEGILRHHYVMPDGHLRDSVYYSILRDEWPGVREVLDARLARG